MESGGPERLIAGRYRLGHVIGRGGMGAVWQARDELLGREVAVKELLWTASLSAEERQVACRRATREARVSARLSHRNVIQVFDIIEEDGCPWIVMELLPPRSLRDRIQQEGVLSPVQAADVGLGILAGLRAAHAAGIVHQDVKPANILLARDRVVLTDFGIARDAGTSAAATTVGVLLGSPSYMAPERARGGHSGPPADLWGLGALLYTAVEGHGPFDRDGGALASMTAALVDEPEPAAHAGPLLWAVISGLLRKDPDERLDAAEAERMLRQVSESPVLTAAGAVFPAGPVSPAEPFFPAGRGVVPGRRPRRVQARSVVLAGAAVLAVLAASGTVVMLELAGAPRSQAAAALAPPATAGPRVPSVRPSASAAARAPAASDRRQAPAEIHLAARTSRTRAAGSASVSSAGKGAGNSNEAGAGTGEGNGKPPKPGHDRGHGHDHHGHGPH